MLLFVGEIFSRECKAVSCALGSANNGPHLGAVGGSLAQLTSEDGARMLREWPRKEKGGKNNI